MYAKKIRKAAPSTSNMTNEEVQEIRDAFNLFDSNGNGKIDPIELKDALKSLGFDSRNPLIFNIVSDLDTKDSTKQGGITFDTFIEAINNKLGDCNSKEGIKRLFDLFIDDPESKTITVNALKKVSKEIGQEIKPEELSEKLLKASKNGVEITFDEFYDIMTKQGL